MSGCSTLKDGLEGNKRSKSAEEFLIDSKNPLTLPPDFDNLPVPEGSSNKNLVEFNIDKIIGNPSNQKKIDKNKEESSLEKSILKSIKNN